MVSFNGNILMWLSFFLVELRTEFPMVGKKEMFYLTMHSTHFIYGYMASCIW